MVDKNQMKTQYQKNRLVLKSGKKGGGDQYNLGKMAQDKQCTAC